MTGPRAQWEDLTSGAWGQLPGVRLTGQVGTCVESKLRSEELVSAFPIPRGSGRFGFK